MSYLEEPFMWVLTIIGLLAIVIVIAILKVIIDYCTSLVDLEGTVIADSDLESEF